MFVRTAKVKQKAGVVEFVQLVHNVRHPKTGVPTLQIMYHFGRKDQLDLDALRRLIKSINCSVPTAKRLPGCSCLKR